MATASACIWFLQFRCATVVESINHTRVLHYGTRLLPCESRRRLPDCRCMCMCAPTSTPTSCVCANLLCSYARGEQLWLNSAFNSISSTYGSGGTIISPTPGYIAVSDAGLVAKMSGSKFNYVTSPGFNGCQCWGERDFLNCALARACVPAVTLAPPVLSPLHFHLRCDLHCSALTWLFFQLHCSALLLQTWHPRRTTARCASPTTTTPRPSPCCPRARALAASDAASGAVGKSM